VTIDYVVSGELQVDGLWFVEGLHFPVQGYEPESAVISSVFDHSIPGDESPWWDGQTFQPRDFLVVAYTGESGDGVPHGIDDTCVRSAEHPDREFVVNGNYKGAQSCGGSTFLSYDTHVGIDWVFDVGNVKVAPANGVITERTQCDENSCWGTGKVEIDHDGPYASVFEHTRRLFDGLAPGMRVHAGQPFAYSGDTGGFAPHVHHSVTLENPDGSFEYVDPYGWNGAYQDPYRHRAVNVRLWR